MYSKTNRRNIKSASRNLAQTPSTRQRQLSIHRRTTSNKESGQIKTLMVKQIVPKKQITPLYRQQTVQRLKTMNTQTSPTNLKTVFGIISSPVLRLKQQNIAKTALHTYDWKQDSLAPKSQVLSGTVKDLHLSRIAINDSDSSFNVENSILKNLLTISRIN